MRRLSTASFFLLAAAGCVSSQAGFDQGMQVVDKAAAIAQKHGLAYEAELTWDGELKGTYRQQVGLDSGIRATFRFRGNAAAGRPVGDGDAASGNALKSAADGALPNPQP